MKQRDYIQEVRDDMGTSGTKTYNLDFTDPITEIALLVEAENGGAQNKDSPVERCISKIEVVDGGEVLWDLPGDVLVAEATHLRGHFPYESHGSVGGLWQTQVFPISFGRYLYDPDFAFNPVAHRNPQLKITFNEATVNAAGANGFVSDSFQLSIIVKLMEEASAPSGFLSFRDIHEYTSLASGDTRIELMTDQIMRLLGIRVYEAGVDMRSSITNYKLSVNGGKFVPFDMHSRYMADKFTEYFGSVLLDLYNNSDHGETHQTWIGINESAYIRSHTDDRYVGAYSAWPGQVQVWQRTNAGVGVNDVAVHIGVRGWCVHNTFLYPFGRLNSPEDWFVPSGVEHLDLFLTNANAGAEVNIVQQVVYPY